MIKKLAPYMKKYKTQLMLGVLCAALEAIFELLIPLVMAQIVDVGISTGNTIYTIKMGLLMLVMAAISLSFGIGLSKFSAIAGQGFGAELRQAEYEKIQTYSFKNIEKFSTASLITRLTTDITMIQNALTMGIKLLVRAPMMLIVACILAVTISPKLAMIFLVSMPVLIISIGLIIKNVKPKFESMQKKIDNLNTTVQENLIGIRVVKSFVRRNKEKEKFKNSNDELLNKCSYVAISSYRRKVLETLKNDVKIPTKISEESGVGIKHVSNVLTDLKEHNLIVCINEDAHKGRLYRLTDEGKNVVSMIGEMGW